MSLYQIQMTTAAGETRLMGATFATRDEAEREMAMRREEGEYTDGREAGDLYAPNVVRVVEVRRADLLAAVSTLVGDDGTGDLGVIVDQALADDPAATAEAVAAIVREAREDAAVEAAREVQS